MPWAYQSVIKTIQGSLGATVLSQQGDGDSGIRERISSADTDRVNQLSSNSGENHVSKEQLVLPVHTCLCQKVLPCSGVSTVF